VHISRSTGGADYSLRRPFLLPVHANASVLRRHSERRLEKSLRLCLAQLRIRRFDAIAEASELPDHSGGAPVLRLFGDGWAPFFVTNSLVQAQPYEPTLSMGNGPDGLVMSQARYRATLHNFEDASCGPGCGVGRLVENAPHVAVALGDRWL
jgi:hypothetical protein